MILKVTHSSLSTFSSSVGEITRPLPRNVWKHLASAYCTRRLHVMRCDAWHEQTHGAVRHLCLLGGMLHKTAQSTRVITWSRHHDVHDVMLFVG